MVAARIIDVCIRLGSKSIVISSLHNVIAIREVRGKKLGPLLHRYPIAEAAEVRLYVGGPSPRKILQLEHEALDLGDAITIAAAMRDAREVSKLVDRPLVIVEEDYLEAYFADHAPILHPYGDRGTVLDVPTVPHLHTAYEPTREVGAEDETLEDFHPIATQTWL